MTFPPLDGDTPPSAETVDPYDTAGLRERVLAAWTASPARFREDANAEEDYALGGYRDRVIVELAQNAADAAVRAGVPGRLLLRLRDGVLTAANTGAPLDAAGVAALATLRASAKDGRHTVGRFGVGFAAVAAVSDEPSIVSTVAGQLAGVRWSAQRTRAVLAGIPELAQELDRRTGQVPVLRLPFPAERGTVRDGHDEGRDEGYDTVVRLPLRDTEAAELVGRQLAEAGPALMLALPALDRITIEADGTVRTFTAVHGAGRAIINGVPWRTVEAQGDIAAELLADRPTEERARPYWQLRWATVDDSGKGLPDDVPAVVYAPTPSAEPLGLPALLLASFPMAPDRRHVASGPLTDFLIDRAAVAYQDLLRELSTTPRLLDMVPGPIAAGELDARIRRAILALLPDSPVLGRQRGRDAVAIDAPAPLVELLMDVLPGLLPVGWPARHPALAALGVRRMELADVIDELAALDRSPDWWHSLYDALAGADPGGLGALPVPLADGRLVRGPRGLLIATDGVDPASLGVLALRFVHPEAAHRLLIRLGAVEAGPRAVLTDPAVRAAVAGSYDDDDPEAIADAVLGLVAAAHLEPGELPWLADLALPGEDGESYPAGELLLPDAPLLAAIAADAPFGVVDREVVKSFGAAHLEAVGVLRTFALLREDDVPLSDVDLSLADEQAWAGDVLARLPEHDVPPMVAELLAVRDLELVEHWDVALPLLSEPPLRAALTDPARVLLADGRQLVVPSYTAWWLRRRPVLSGHRPDRLRSPDADPLLACLYDVAPAGLDPELLRALGVRTSLGELLAEPSGADELLERMADPSRTIPRADLRQLWTALAEVSVCVPPDRIRVVVDGQVEVADSGDALVLDQPDLLPLLTGQPLVIVPADRAEHLAELLDIPLAGEEVPGVVESRGTVRPVPDVVREVLPDVPATYVAHDRLIVDGRSVPWRYDGRLVGRAVHASGPAGLARGLAWACDRWADRLLVEAVLAGPAALPFLLAEADLE